MQMGSQFLIPHAGTILGPEWIHTGSDAAFAALKIDIRPAECVEFACAQADPGGKHQNHAKTLNAASVHQRIRALIGEIPRYDPLPAI
jgi:hypothetical protein